MTTPLWELMEEAFLAGSQPGFHDHLGYAAEIRAVADWLVPEQSEPPRSPHMGNFMGNALWQQRHDLRARLLAEADRAEKDDG